MQPLTRVIMAAEPSHTRHALALLVFAATLLLVASIGGGWWALGRVDPLLAVPGLAVASLAAAIVARGASAGGSALKAALAHAAVATLTLGLAAWLAAGWVPWTQIFIAAGVVACLQPLCVRLWRSVRADWQRGWARRGGALLLILGALVVWQQLSWRAVDWAAQPALPADAARVRMVSALPLRMAMPLRVAMSGGGASPLSGASALNGWQEAPVVGALAARTRLTIAEAPGVLGDGSVDVLLLAHPRALAPADLVAIDAWVRGGGRVLLLADGLSSWPPPYPLGDARNPPITSLLTPLLTHWGLRLDAPVALVQRPALIRYGRHRLRLFSAGQFVREGAGSACTIRDGGMLADCRIGKGRALLIADADWIDARWWQGSGRRGAIGWSNGNMDALAAMLADLAGRPALAHWAAPVWTR